MTTDRKMIGPYEVQGVIGSGGMGVVYRAVQPSLKRFVAIKVLPAHLAQNRELAERFQREARSVAALDHPSIVTIYDIGESDGTAYFVMKFLVGDTLEEHIEEDGRLPLDKALLFTEQLAGALGAAHQAGVIHRDVKPANIIVHPLERRVVLTDFGIALTLDETRLTRPGAMFGSPIYVAPEQLEGDDVDHRADFYSLGSVLYQMLAGCPPYEAEIPVAILHQRLKDPEKSVREVNPEVPEPVDQLVRKLMARDPDHRFQHADELLKTLRDLKENPDKPIPPALSSPAATMALETVSESVASKTDHLEEPAPQDPSPAAEYPPVPETPPPAAAHSPQPGIAPASRGLIGRFGQRRIILTWIGVMAMVLMVLMVVVWWNRNTAPPSGDSEPQVRLKPLASENSDVGETAGEDDPAEGASLDREGSLARPAEEGPKEGVSSNGAPSENPTDRNAEPPVVTEKPVDVTTESQTSQKAAVRPLEVGIQPPSGPRGVSPKSAPPPVSEVELSSALEAAKTSRQSALDAGAPEHVPRLWAAGEEQMEAGARHKSGNRPDLEKKAYGDAAASFGQALEEAVPAAEALENAAEAGAAELAILGTRIDEGIAAGTGQRLEDARQALERFREIAPQDTRIDRYAARLDEAESGRWQTHGMTRSFVIGQGVEMSFIWVPPGTFRMGTVAPTKATHSDESPKHTVVISKGFWLGMFEVTQSQWQVVMGGNPSRFKGADHPVDGISWNDAQAFVNKLNEAAGAGRFRLPTEAEWEFSCRAGTSRSFCGGEINTVGCENEDHLAPWAWYCHNSRDASHPVGRKQPNGWGFHDMHGNVGEWCSDYYDRDYFEDSPTRNPQGPAKGKNRVLRGGSWDSRAWNCRSAFRGRYKPSANNNSFGLRIVRTAD